LSEAGGEKHSLTYPQSKIVPESCQVVIVVQALNTSPAERDRSDFPLNAVANFCAQLTYQITIDSATPESTTASWNFFQNLLIFSDFCVILKTSKTPASGTIGIPLYALPCQTTVA
jgi:hypothetical protein